MRRPTTEQWTQVVSDLIPVAGVVLLGWDRHAALFILSCEVIAGAFVVGWLFNYPERSHAAGLTLAALFVPVGFLMWVVLAEGFTSPRSVSGTVATLLPRTWFAVAIMLGHTATSCLSSMRCARHHGASLAVNDGLLLRWIFGGFAPFVVFSLVSVAGPSLGPMGLAAVLLTKSLADLAFQSRVRASAQPACAPQRSSPFNSA
jgi:hypothetical protein